MEKKKSLNRIFGSRHSAKSDREANDFYATHPNTMRAFLTKVQEDNLSFGKGVWECACGEGHMAEELRNVGHNVYATDLIDRGYSKLNKVHDFLSELPSEIKDNEFDIITGPPYKYETEFAYKGLEHLKEGRYLCMLVKIQFLEGAKRRELFDKFPPKYVYVYSKRQQLSKNADWTLKCNTFCYCWVIWKKGHIGPTELRWI